PDAVSCMPFRGYSGYSWRPRTAQRNSFAHPHRAVQRGPPSTTRARRNAMSTGSSHRIRAGWALLSLLALTSAANAQTNCSPPPGPPFPTGSCTPACTSGPDVIVGDLGGISNYTSNGTIDALSMGTVSCNPGNVWVNWFQSTTQHPVIGQTLYKYSVV